MSEIKVTDLTFGYEGSSETTFEHVTLTMLLVEHDRSFAEKCGTQILPLFLLVAVLFDI